MVRRFKGLWRFPAKSFLLSFRFPLSSCSPALLPCLASALGLVLFSWSLWLVFWSWLGCWLSFPFGRLQIQKEGARIASLPRLVVLLVGWLESVTDGQLIQIRISFYKIVYIPRVLAIVAIIPHFSAPYIDKVDFLF